MKHKRRRRRRVEVWTREGFGGGRWVGEGS